MVNIDKETLALLGGWLFVAIQFGKGKVWGDRFTAYLAYALPCGLAAVPVWGGPQLNLYVQWVASLFLIATGTWAVNKVAGGGASLPVPVPAPTEQPKPQDTPQP